MRCAWDQLIGLLPGWMRQDADRLGKDTLQELRLRIGLPPELICADGRKSLSRKVNVDDLNFCVNTASRYSPWSAATVSQGYITAPGGHRIGLCGDAAMQDGKLRGIRTISSLCIRVARDFPGIAGDADKHSGSVLIIGAPGSGKTTLLRDLIRRRSEAGPGSIAVVDERGELFPPGCFPCGNRTDVMTGCCKSAGVEMLLRTMGPACIATDEITAKEDCEALLHAARCGVKLLATAHAADRNDLLSRPVYAPLVQYGIFDTLLILQPDKSWHAERIRI